MLVGRYPNVPQLRFLGRRSPEGDGGTKIAGLFCGIWWGTTLLVDDDDDEAENDEADGNKSEDEWGSISGVEWTIVLDIVGGASVRRWRCGGIGLEVPCVCLVVGHGG